MVMFIAEVLLCRHAFAYVISRVLWSHVMWHKVLQKRRVQRNYMKYMGTTHHKIAPNITNERLKTRCTYLWNTIHTTTTKSKHNLSLIVKVKRKRKRSDQVIWQKPLHPQKTPKSNVTTQKTSITQRLRTDLGRSVGVTTATPTGVVKSV